MVKICQTGLLKLNFETRPKKPIFRFLPKISAGPLGCQGWVVIHQNVKKVKITAPVKTSLPHSQRWTRTGSYGDGFTYATGHGFSLLGHESRGSLHADTWAEIRHPHLATGWVSVLSWGEHIRSRLGLPPIASKTARLGEEQLYYVVAHNAQVGVPRKNMSTEQWD